MREKFDELLRAVDSTIEIDENTLLRRWTISEYNEPCDLMEVSFRLGICKYKSYFIKARDYDEVLKEIKKCRKWFEEDCKMKPIDKVEHKV